MSTATFSILPTAILQDRRLTASELRVLGSLYSFRSSSSDFRVWPSRIAIAVRAGITHVDSVSRTIGKLVKRGYVKVQRRQSSSVYHLLLPSQDPTTGSQIRPDYPPSDEETIDQTIKLSPIVEAVPVPVAVGEREKFIIVPEAVQVEAEAEAVAVVPVVEEIQVEAVCIPEAVAVVPVVEEILPEAIVEAVQIIRHLNSVTHSHLPTDTKSATVRRVVQHLATYSAQDIRDAISFGAKKFRIPAAMLTPVCLESLISQVKADQDRHSARIEKERAVLASLKPSAPSNPTVARSALSGLRGILRGGSSRGEVLGSTATA